MRILLAEDEVTIFVTLRDALEEAGHEVLGATNTTQALEALEAADARPEVAFRRARAGRSRKGGAVSVRVIRGGGPNRLVAGSAPANAHR